MDADAPWLSPEDELAVMGPYMVPEMPEWLAAIPVGTDEIPPFCPCCVEPEPVHPKDIHWAIPGVTTVASPVEEPPPPSPLVVEAQVIVERLANQCARSMPGTQAFVDTSTLLSVAEQLRVVLLDRLADVNGRQLQDRAVFHSTARWLQHAHPDTTDLPLAKKLSRYPFVNQRVRDLAVGITAARRTVSALELVRPYVDRADGFIDGQPGGPVVTAVVGHVVDLVCRFRMGLHDDEPLLQQLIVRTDEIVESRGSQLEQLEQGFALLAEHVPLRYLRESLDLLVLAVVPNLLEERALRAEQRRRLGLEPVAGGPGWQLEGDLDDETGELLFTILAAEARRDDANASDTRAAQLLRDRGLNPFDGSPAPDDPLPPRGRSRRLHDAFKNMLQRYLDADLAGTHDKQPVAIAITMSSELIECWPGALPATTGSGRPLSRRQLRQWWCNAKTTAFILSRGWIPLGVQHTGRTLTATERTAMSLRDGRRCGGVGCCRGSTDDPLADLEPHHVHGYAESGNTQLDETIWACPSLHHDLHHGRVVLLRSGRYLTEKGWADPPAPSILF